MRLLSQTYQGLPPLDPPPVYEEPSGSCSYTDLSPVETPCHNSTYPIGRPPVQTQEPVRLDFRLTERQTQELKEAVRRMGPTKQDGMRWLSRQDCLVALLAKCISIADSTSAAVDTIHTLLNVSWPPPLLRILSDLCVAGTWQRRHTNQRGRERPYMGHRKTHAESRPARHC